MKPALLPIESILFGSRRREDLGDIAELAESIRTQGLIQPIVINEKLELIAGGRRYTAMKSLGWTEVPVVLMETQGSEAKLRRLELEENVKRKEMNWKEKCQSIAEIHRLHRKEAITDGDSWTQDQTGRLLGVSAGNVNYCLEMTKYLKDPNHPVQKAESLSEAFRILIQLKEDACLKDLASTLAPNVKPIALAPGIIPVVSTPKLSLDSLVNFTPKITTPPDAAQTPPPPTQSGKPLLEFPFSSYFHRGDCRDHMKAFLPESFDAIITDPPYAIDMEMLQQDSTTMLNVDRTANEHQVEENLSLLTDLFPAAFRVLKPSAWLVLFCDTVHFSALSNLATEAGFKVQRWPLVWVKTSNCKNEAAAYNFTKATELALVCRKGNTVLTSPQHTNYWIGGQDELRNQLAHPFVKPAGLWQWIARAVVQPGSTIYDPFMGTGSGPLSLLKIGYQVVGSEKNETHYNTFTGEMQNLVYALHGDKHEIKFV